MHVGVVAAHRVRRAVGRARTHRDGDRLAVAQRDDERAARHRRIHRRRVNNAAAFAHARARGSEGHRRRVRIVGHVGRHRAGRGQRFKLATARAGDAHRQGVRALHVGVVAAHRVRRAVGRARTHRDGDRLAVAQRDDERAARHRRIHRRRVNNAAAFAHARARGSEGHRRRVRRRRNLFDQYIATPTAHFLIHHHLPCRIELKAQRVDTFADAQQAHERRPSIGTGSGITRRCFFEQCIQATALIDCLDHAVNVGSANLDR